MSERQVNIFLPLHVPECSYRQPYVMGVLMLLQWCCGHKWLSIIHPCWCRLKRRKVRRPCRLRWTTRPDLTHGKFVADHGLVVMFVGTILQDWGRKVYQQVPIGMEQRRPRSRRGVIPLAWMRARAARVRLCKAWIGWELWAGYASMSES